MSEEKREEIDEAAGLYVISVAAELSGLHPQTLRQYDRIGLVSPSRTVGQSQVFVARHRIAAHNSEVNWRRHKSRRNKAHHRTRICDGEYGN